MNVITQLIREDRVAKTLTHDMIKATTNFHSYHNFMTISYTSILHAFMSIIELNSMDRLNNILHDKFELMRIQTCQVNTSAIESIDEMLQ